MLALVDPCKRLLPVQHVGHTDYREALKKQRQTSEHTTAVVQRVVGSLDQVDGYKNTKM